MAKEQTYETALARLEEIVESFEQNTLELSASKRHKNFLSSAKTNLSKLMQM